MPPACHTSLPCRALWRGPTGPFRKLPPGSAPWARLQAQARHPAPLTWDLTAALSGPLSPPAPSGPLLPPEAFLVPAAAAPSCWSPRNRLPWGHRPRGDMGPRGPRRDLLLLQTQGHLELTLRPRIHLRGGLGASPDTSRGRVVRRVSGGKGREPRNRPGRGSREASRRLGQVVGAGLSWRGVWLGRSSRELRARPRGAHAGLPGRLAPPRGQDAELSASLPCWAGRAVCWVLGAGVSAEATEPHLPDV